RAGGAGPAGVGRRLCEAVGAVSRRSLRPTGRRGRRPGGGLARQQSGPRAVGQRLAAHQPRAGQGRVGSQRLPPRERPPIGRRHRCLAARGRPARAGAGRQSGAPVRLLGPVHARTSPGYHAADALHCGLPRNCQLSPFMSTRVLTGITTTGTPHLGNYAGAIRPAIQASRQPGIDGFYFMADYHALIKCDDPARVARSRLELAATWLAAGLDTERVTFYRQSDIPEIPELCWLLTCVTAKGLMNRAHAYKASVDQNAAKGVDPDDGITMGLFSYPILMAADILLFNAHKVPVGRDQIQHLEMARDIAQRFNHLYGREYFVLPEVVIEEEVATLPGLDGRKMSKSYNNAIPLFEGGAAALRAAVMRIVTDSRQPGEPKDAEASHLYTLYRAFSTPAESAAFRAQLEEGLGWGDAKQALCERIERDLAPMRERYQDLIANPGRIEEILQAGAQKARKLATPFIAE